MTGAGLWLQLMLPATLLRGRAPAAHHQALPRHRARQGEGRHRGRGIEPHAGPRVPAAGPARHGLRQVPQVPLRRAAAARTSTRSPSTSSAAASSTRRRSVFGFIHKNDPKFKDVAERMQRAKAMSETIILGGSSAARSNAATMVLQGGQAEKPMLGRYQVEKELGKGAMGVVYLGKDPKIGRDGRHQDAWRCPPSSRATSCRRPRSASSARPRRPGASRTRTSSRSTTRARSTTSPTSPWSSSRARTSCPT